MCFFWKKATEEYSRSVHRHWRGIKGALNPNFLNMTIHREKNWL